MARGDRDPRHKDAVLETAPGQGILTPEQSYARVTTPDVRGRTIISIPSAARTQASQGLPPSERRVQEFGPWLHPPFGAYPFDAPTNRIPTVIAIGGTLAFTLPFGKIPPGSTGVVWRVGLSTNVAADTRYSSRFDGNVVPPYGGALGALGVLENPTRLEAPIIIPTSVAFDIFIENIGLGAITVAVRIMGWTYSS